MKLYGLAIAVVPKKDNPEIMGVICTAIAVDDSDLKKFETLENYTFKTQFGLMDTAALIDCFTKLVGTLDAVVKLQKQSLEECKLPYQPVVLEIGQDSRSPTNLNAIYSHLFGERLLVPLNPTEVEEKCKRETFTKYCEKYRIEESRLTEIQKKSMLEYVEKELSDNIKRKVEQIISKLSMFEKEADLALQAREAFFGSESDSTKMFLESCEKLSDLIDKCTLLEGSFAVHRGVGNNYKSDLERLQKHPGNLVLTKLQRDLNDPELAYAAHEKIIEIAKKRGEIFGNSTNRNLREFAAYAPQGTEDLPINAFFGWDPDYRQAFIDGFNSSYQGPSTRNFKLPLDPSNLPFVDPCRDRIIDEHRVAKGLRFENAAQDRPDTRAIIADSCKRFIESMREPRTEISTEAFLQMIRDANRPDRTVS